MTATGTPDERKGCGAEATRIVFRGRKRRLYLCADCPYKGNGAIHPYETQVEGEERGGSTFMGPRKACGDEQS